MLWLIKFAVIKRKQQVTLSGIIFFDTGNCQFFKQTTYIMTVLLLLLLLCFYCNNKAIVTLIWNLLFHVYTSLVLLTSTTQEWCTVYICLWTKRHNVRVNSFVCYCLLLTTVLHCVIFFVYLRLVFMTYRQLWKFYKR